MRKCALLLTICLALSLLLTACNTAAKNDAPTTTTTDDGYVPFTFPTTASPSLAFETPKTPGSTTQTVTTTTTKATVVYKPIAVDGLSIAYERDAWYDDPMAYTGADYYRRQEKFLHLIDPYLSYTQEAFGNEALAAFWADVERPLNYSNKNFFGNGIYNWVKYFDIPRDIFETLNDNAAAHLGTDHPKYAERIYTDEEIEDIFTLSVADFNQKYKAPTTISCNGVLFDFHWLYRNEPSTWLNQAFTVEDAQAVLNAAKKDKSIPKKYIEKYEDSLWRFTNPDKLYYWDGPKEEAPWYGRCIDMSDDELFDKNGLEYLPPLRKALADIYGWRALTVHDLRMEAAAEVNPYGYTGYGTYHLVRDFGVAKEELIASNELYKNDSENYDGKHHLSDEEINDMFSLSLAEFNQKHGKTDQILFVGDLTYSYYWFYNHTLEDWLDQPFTLEQLEAFFRVVRKGRTGKNIYTFEDLLRKYRAAVK
ncbi:MAG: hypothetical protein IJF42_06010 [Clostridia bacterium]|nr:hypothetical protein [Clostridia bacterium]